MIEWVWRRAIGSKALRVVVATDDQRILKVCIDIGAEAYLTSENILRHRSDCRSGFYAWVK